MLYEKDQIDIEPIKVDTMVYKQRLYYTFTSITRHKLNIILEIYELMLAEIEDEVLTINSDQVIQKKEMIRTKEESKLKKEEKVIKEQNINTTIPLIIGSNEMTLRIRRSKPKVIDYCDSFEDVIKPTKKRKKINQKCIDKNNIQRIENKDESLNKNKSNDKEIIKEIICFIDDDDDDDDNGSPIESLYLENVDDEFNEKNYYYEEIIPKQITTPTMKTDYDHKPAIKEEIDKDETPQVKLLEEIDEDETPQVKMLEQLQKDHKIIISNSNKNLFNSTDNNLNFTFDASKDNNTQQQSYPKFPLLISRENDISIIRIQKEPNKPLINQDQSLQSSVLSLSNDNNIIKQREKFQRWSAILVEKLANVVKETINNKQNILCPSIRDYNQYLKKEKEKKKELVALFQVLKPSQMNDLWKNILHLPDVVNGKYYMKLNDYSKETIDRLMIVAKKYHEDNVRKEFISNNQRKIVDYNKNNKGTIPSKWNSNNDDPLFSSLSDSSSSSSIPSTMIENANNVNNNKDNQNNPINNKDKDNDNIQKLP